MNTKLSPEAEQECCCEVIGDCEICNPTTPKFAAIADNGGGLHLYVFDDDGVCVFAGESMSLDAIVDNIKALRDGEDSSLWDRDPEIDPKTSWEEWTEESQRNGGHRVVITDDGPANLDLIRAWRNARDLLVALGEYQCSDFE